MKYNELELWRLHFRRKANRGRPMKLAELTDDQLARLYRKHSVKAVARVHAR